jgi:hypothetical protein
MTLLKAWWRVLLGVVDPEGPPSDVRRALITGGHGGRTERASRGHATKPGPGSSWTR